MHTFEHPTLGPQTGLYSTEDRSKYCLDRPLNQIVEDEVTIALERSKVHPSCGYKYLRNEINGRPVLLRRANEVLDQRLAAMSNVRNLKLVQAA